MHFLMTSYSSIQDLLREFHEFLIDDESDVLIKWPSVEATDWLFFISEWNPTLYSLIKTKNKQLLLFLLK